MNAVIIGILETADIHLSDAHRALAAGLYRPAARAAYSASLQAARAFIYSRTGQAAKTHRGARSEFSRLVTAKNLRDRLPTDLLAHGYDMKVQVDYGDTPVLDFDENDMRDYLDRTTKFVEQVKRLAVV